MSDLKDRRPAIGSDAAQCAGSCSVARRRVSGTHIIFSLFIVSF